VIVSSSSVRMNRAAKGFSIVEVLVALVVLGVGMLGIAGLYVVSLRSSGSAISRMQAVNLASDLADRIRANRNARDAYADEAADHECVGAEAACSAADMATHDLFLWQQQIAATLGSTATGTVEVAAAGTPTLRRYTITVQWNEPGQTEPLSYQLRMQI
jgi:type IV pilus assembly protein PilV